MGGDRFFVVGGGCALLRIMVLGSCRRHVFGGKRKENGIVN
jgi:hypothetical protein